MRHGVACTLLLVVASSRAFAVEATPPVAAVRVTILSSMIVDYVGENEAVGEWGFAALVEVDGRKILFDTGAHPDTVLHNARALHIDLADVSDVVLSHFHDDHTSGLVALRRELRKKNPHAMERAHVAAGFFWPRKVDGKEWTDTERMRREYTKLGGQFVEHSAASELYPGVWLTGPVERRTDERNFPGGIEVRRPDGRWTIDDVPDDDSLVIDTQSGLVVVSGCGHAGIVNTLNAAVEHVRDGRIKAVIGGLHLYKADDSRLDWTGAQLRRFGVEQLLGAHCTGIEALFRLRAAAGLTRASAVQGAVGSRYALDQGIDAGPAGLTR